MKKGWVSLSFRHPTKDLRYLGDALGLQQHHGWVAGEPWLTKSGTVKPSKSDNYWNSGFAFSEDRGFANDVKKALGLLEKKNVKIAELIASGGRVSITLDFQGVINNGDEIDSPILKKIGDLGINFGIEIFPAQQHWDD